ncbi:MAG: 50S ribosomal protein L29 [Bacteroidia bacterium]|nr:50S ribosomal protein L29 [Bacteroidia bacterium]
MKAKEIRDLTTPELIARIKDEDDKLLRLRLNHAVSAIENPSEIRDTRKAIARLNTILRERQLAEKANN